VEQVVQAVARRFDAVIQRVSADPERAGSRLQRSSPNEVGDDGALMFMRKSVDQRVDVVGCPDQCLRSWAAVEVNADHTAVHGADAGTAGTRSRADPNRPVGQLLMPAFLNEHAHFTSPA